MQSKLTQFINVHVSAKYSLIKAIADDTYKNWQQHFNNCNSTANSKADPLEMKASAWKSMSTILKPCSLTSASPMKSGKGAAMAVYKELKTEFS